MALQKIVSFGYKHGLPPKTEADIVVDVRSLFKNPYRDPALRDKTGLDPAVVAAVMQGSKFESKFAYVKAMATVPATPVVYIGCTGGRHRSVMIAERLGRELGVPVEHRDLDKP